LGDVDAHAYHHTLGSGHLYQGRFKSIPIEEDAHLLTVCRYVDRNPVRAGLVARVEQWQWGSAAQRLASATENVSALCQGPVPRPTDWTTWVNAPQTLADEQALRRRIRRGQPCGTQRWVAQVVERSGQETTQRLRCRPRKDRPDARQPLLFDFTGS